MGRESKFEGGVQSYRTQLRVKPGKSQMRLRIRRLLRSFPMVPSADKGKLNEGK
ncbi:hypothetical protein D3C85_844360 [compost metagenome]